MEYKLDEIDLKIVRLMQENARINNAELARILGMAPSAVLERVKIRTKRGSDFLPRQSKPKCS